MSDTTGTASGAGDDDADTPGPQFIFVRDGLSHSYDWTSGPDSVRKAVGEALNARNVAFLLAAGCSSLKVDGKECGIPTMQPLAEHYCAENVKPLEDGQESNAMSWRLSADERSCLAAMGVDLKDPEYTRNLERLMETLHSLHFVLNRSVVGGHDTQADVVAGAISKVKQFLWNSCTDGALEQSENPVLKLYEAFYRRLVFRERSLPRPWVFTTNYDVFNERAMDRLGLPYANGFSGVVERRFNPSTFRYALAEQLDLSQKKWSAVDGFVYLCKLHGSVSWTEDGHGLFPIREQWPSNDAGKVMIYPTPAKQNSSLGSPYADLFREFQHRIVREQSVLITVGYAFGDEHINNIIYQALTVPTFRLIIFANPSAVGEVAKLRALNDPRIWIIGGDGPAPDKPAHYFTQVVESFMPQRPPERIEAAVKKVLEAFGTPEPNAADGDDH